MHQQTHVVFIVVFYVGQGTLQYIHKGDFDGVAYHALQMGGIFRFLE